MTAGERVNKNRKKLRKIIDMTVRFGYNEGAIHDDTVNEGRASDKNRV